MALIWSVGDVVLLHLLLVRWLVSMQLAGSLPGETFIPLTRNMCSFFRFCLFQCERLFGFYSKKSCTP
jgi:hypothetical protein